MTLSLDPLASDAAEDAGVLQIAVVASATFHRDVLAYVLGKDNAFHIGPSVRSLDELDARANGQVDVAVVVLPDDTGVAVLARSADRSWSAQLTCGEPTVIVGWDKQPVELRKLLKQALSRPSRRNGVRAVKGTPPARLQPRVALRVLTDRELEVLVALAEGRSASDTATALGISPNTVRTHVTNLLRKLGAHSRLEAVAMARGRLRAEQHRRDMNTSRDVR